MVSALGHRFASVTYAQQLAITSAAQCGPPGESVDGYGFWR